MQEAPLIVLFVYSFIIGLFAGMTGGFIVFAHYSQYKYPSMMYLGIASAVCLWVTITYRLAIMQAAVKWLGY